MTTLIVIFTFFLVFLIGLLVIWWLMRKADENPGWLNPTVTFKGSLPNTLMSAFGSRAVQTRIIFNGQQYSSVEEMPEDVRRTYEQAMSGVLADSDRNGIPDVFESGGGSLFHTELVTPNLASPTEKLKQLKEMRDSGLITEQEYESKRAEILARM